MVSRRGAAASEPVTSTWISVADPAGSTSGASTISWSTPVAPAISAAYNASSRKPVPGNSVTPATWWSASHGWVRSDSTPVNTRVPPSASDMLVCSSGCPVVDTPEAAGPPAWGRGMSQ